jgi:hypothetical protein
MSSTAVLREMSIVFSMSSSSERGPPLRECSKTVGMARPKPLEFCQQSIQGAQGFRAAKLTP